MKIIFVNPPLFWSDLYSEWDLSKVDSISPPIGLLRLAAVTRKRGFDVSIIDARALGINHKQTVAQALSTNPDVIGITATTDSIYSAAEIAGLIKQESKDILTLIGGPHLTAVPKKTMDIFPQFDIGIIGEGEETLIELLDALENNEDLGKIQGIIWRKNGQLHKTSLRPSIKNLDKLPLPAWDLLPSLTENYRLSVVGTKSKLSAPLITSRGCPFRCIFCDTAVFGQRIRGYSAGYVIKMIKYLISNYGIRDFLIYDDNFVALRKRAIQICQMIKDENLEISWSCCARVNLVDAELLKMMKEAGCWQIEYGIESGSQRLLDFMKKGITLSQVKDALQLTKQAGISTRGNFIFGNILETEETLQETIDFILNLELDYFQQTFLTPYPGSEAYAIASEYGTFDPDWKKMNNLYINFVPTGLTKSDLIKYSKLAFRKFYLRQEIIMAQVRQIMNLQDLGRSFDAFQSFIKTCFR